MDAGERPNLDSTGFGFESRGAHQAGNTSSTVGTRMVCGRRWMDPSHLLSQLP